MRCFLGYKPETQKGEVRLVFRKYGTAGYFFACAIHSYEAIFLFVLIAESLSDSCTVNFVQICVM